MQNNPLRLKIIMSGLNINFADFTTIVLQATYESLRPVYFRCPPQCSQRPLLLFDYGGRKTATSFCFYYLRNEAARAKLRYHTAANAGAYKNDGPN